MTNIEEKKHGPQTVELQAIRNPKNPHISLVPAFINGIWQLGSLEFGTEGRACSERRWLRKDKFLNLSWLAKPIFRNALQQKFWKKKWKLSTSLQLQPYRRKKQKPANRTEWNYLLSVNKNKSIYNKLLAPLIWGLCFLGIITRNMVRTICVCIVV